SIWAKRHGADASGNRIVKKELLRAAILGSGKTPADSYTDSVIIDRPYGNSSGDLGTIVDNGTQYLVSAGTDEGKINIIELTSDCSDIVGSAPTASLEWFLPDGHVDHREAPAIFRQGNYFFLTTSGKTSWRPNQQKYAYSEFLAGPWSDKIDVGDSTAYHSQLFGSKTIKASDGSGNTSKLFSGTRNAATWNGSDSRQVWMPLYFNTPTDLATNYYDYLEINHTKGTARGLHYDHGTQLAISSATVEGSGDSASALIDANLTTSWYNNNDASKTAVVFDLGKTQLIKGLKLKQYDLYKNGGTEADVTLRTPRLKVETHNGSGFQTVFEDIVGSITWLQSLDLIDTSSRYLRLSLLENHKGNSAGTSNDFGFYEVEIWGQNAHSSALIDDAFSAETPGNAPQDWTVNAGTDTSAEVVDDGGNQVLKLTDNKNSARVFLTRTTQRKKALKSPRLSGSNSQPWPKASTSACSPTAKCWSILSTQPVSTAWPSPMPTSTTPKLPTSTLTPGINWCSKPTPMPKPLTSTWTTTWSGVARPLPIAATALMKSKSAPPPTKPTLWFISTTSSSPGLSLLPAVATRCSATTLNPAAPSGVLCPAPGQPSVTAHRCTTTAPPATM
ncbi:MAG: family 43 glycosylhydrolase, partial [Porticoccaceae bacterium]|nr:family 43 glycosylhydrolase [Porticoccaceae bacterium]